MRPDRLSMPALKRAQNCIDRIESLDAMIEWIARGMESEAEVWGADARRSFGQQRLHAAPANRDLGRIVAMAIMQHALTQRAALAAEVEDLVELRDPPDLRRLAPASGDGGGDA